MIKGYLAAVWVMMAITLSACSGSPYAPVVDYSSGSSAAKGIHVVRSGDTLYSIAWRYGKDFRALARANNIRSPYTIYPGQQIHLDKKVSASTSRPSSTSSATQSATQTTRQTSPSSTQSRPSASKRPSSSSSSTHGATVGSWQWPASGPLLSRFVAKNVARQGILIGGKKGDPVNAAEDGVVVYRGDGLTGYGNLLIIKHNEIWLSAYAHNDKMLVKEGEKVKAGQKVATLGDTGTTRHQLHFEIRRNGTPVDPLGLLPKR